MRVSVVVTVLNEASSLPRLLDSLAEQTRPPEEMVVCDGGSTDATLDLLRAERRFPVVVLQQPGANISQGRNAAIQAASGDVLAVTDAGVWLSADWVEKIVAPFENPAVQGVAGFFRPDPHTVFETALGATVLPELEDVNPLTFLPSSRSVAFRRGAWAAVGGYPEWIDYCEDLIFDLRVRARCGPFAFAPQAVAHFRPRADLRTFLLQYFRYARGDGKADLWRERHAIRYLTYLAAVPLLAVVGMVFGPWWWMFYLVAIAGLFGAGWRRLPHLWGDLEWAQKLQAALWVPGIRITGDVAKMLGYPVGLWWRRQHRADIPDWRASTDQE